MKIEIGQIYRFKHGPNFKVVVNKIENISGQDIIEHTIISSSNRLDIGIVRRHTKDLFLGVFELIYEVEGFEV